ncbi:VOC family protein [Streptomyces sp. NBC_00448]|uniref:VOC family protein n=1 Tax=Streptomyces sp. NBC_00448 TaxID=2903652 RepID=UPI002E221B83
MAASPSRLRTRRVLGLHRRRRTSRQRLRRPPSNRRRGRSPVPLPPQLRNTRRRSEDAPRLPCRMGQRQGEVDRLTALGARLRWEVLDEHPGMRLTVLADPEDNLFCVVEVQSAE